MVFELPDLPFKENAKAAKAALADELMRATLTSGPMLGANRTAYGAGDWMGPQ